MRSTTRLKKNSSIEIRLPDQTKALFMERCQRDGRTASDVAKFEKLDQDRDGALTYREFSTK
jgi:hypothetical protein